MYLVIYLYLYIRNCTADGMDNQEDTFIESNKTKEDTPSPSLPIDATSVTEDIEKYFDLSALKPPALKRSDTISMNNGINISTELNTEYNNRPMVAEKLHLEEEEEDINDIVEKLLSDTMSKLTLGSLDNIITTNQINEIGNHPRREEEEINKDSDTSSPVNAPELLPTGTQSEIENTTQIDMYNNPQFNLCLQKAVDFEASDIGDYYKKHFCLQPCSSSKYKCRKSTIEKYYAEMEDYITNSLDEVMKYNQTRLCVLQKGHTGECSSCPFSQGKILKHSRVSNKMETSINSCIYQVPGDTSGNSYFKNRASRLYPIVVSSDTKIKMKKASCTSKMPKICISLKEHTTPFQMATAYIDWVTYATHIDEMEDNFMSSIAEPFLGWKDLLVNRHAAFLQNHFKSRNRKIFDTTSGVRKTICAVKQDILTVANFADISRDNRINIDPNDIQMGHIVPRSNNEFTIRGTNLLMMTRDGNRAVGENDYLDDSWILRDISILQNLCSPKMD